MKIFTIYRATCIINGKSYIGFDSMWPRRKQNHIWEAERGGGYMFHRAIRKHGAENFVWDVLYEEAHI